MQYKVLKAFNGRTRRFVVGAEVGFADLADALLATEVLVERKYIELVPVSVPSVARQSARRRRSESAR